VEVDGLPQERQRLHGLRAIESPDDRAAGDGHPVAHLEIRHEQRGRPPSPALDIDERGVLIEGDHPRGQRETHLIAS
jgi:hypothetical protein